MGTLACLLFIILPPSFCLDEFRQNDGGRMIEAKAMNAVLLDPYRQTRRPQQPVAEQCGELRLREIRLMAE